MMQPSQTTIEIAGKSYPVKKLTLSYDNEVIMGYNGLPPKPEHRNCRRTVASPPPPRFKGKRSKQAAQPPEEPTTESKLAGWALLTKILGLW